MNKKKLISIYSLDNNFYSRLISIIFIAISICENLEFLKISWKNDKNFYDVIFNEFN